MKICALIQAAAVGLFLAAGCKPTVEIEGAGGSTTTASNGGTGGATTGTGGTTSTTTCSQTYIPFCETCSELVVCGPPGPSYKGSCGSSELDALVKQAENAGLSLNCVLCQNLTTVNETTSACNKGCGQKVSCSVNGVFPFQGLCPGTDALDAYLKQHSKATCEVSD